MPTFRATTSIAASADRVWSILSDVVEWPKWLPTVTAVEPLDSSALKIGSRFTVLQPKLRPAVWSVTELNPGRNFIWASSSPGVRVIGNHSINPDLAGATAVTLEISFVGVLSRVVGLLAGRLTRDYLAQEATALKRVAETVPESASRA